jgi:hypothetical protein
MNGHGFGLLVDNHDVRDLNPPVNVFPVLYHGVSEQKERVYSSVLRAGASFFRFLWCGPVISWVINRIHLEENNDECKCSIIFLSDEDIHGYQ